ncbi:MAG TPA: hypothetical protein DG942_00875 [Ruminococcaceae bacterium]|nr:hypothetical protein [Oscillospiraceae bacterium]
MMPCRKTRGCIQRKYKLFNCLIIFKLLFCRVFSDQYLYWGLAQVTNWVRLKFAAMNLKKLAMWKMEGLPSFRLHIAKRTHPSLNASDGFFDNLY